MSCPKCGSNDWKFASVVHAGGLSTISTSTVGVGVGADADALGGGVGKTTGTQQTELSKLAAPPSKPMRPAAALAKCFGVSILVGIPFFLGPNIGDHPVIIIYCFFVAPIILLVSIVRILMTPKISKEIAERHRLLMDEYAKKKMCMKCGTFYLEDGIDGLVMQPVSRQTRNCPYCAETIKAEAKLCRFCKHDVQPLGSTQKPLVTLNEKVLASVEAERREPISAENEQDSLQAIKDENPRTQAGSGRKKVPSTVIRFVVGLIAGMLLAICILDAFNFLMLTVFPDRYIHPLGTVLMLCVPVIGAVWYALRRISTAKVLIHLGLVAVMMICSSFSMQHLILNMKREECSRATYVSEFCMDLL